MTEQRTKEKRFNHGSDMFELPDAGVIAHVSISGRMVNIEECDLDVAEARALRDWLNKVLPKDSCKPGEHSYQDVAVCVHCGDQP